MAEMEKLLEAADQQASTINVIEEIEEMLFHHNMGKNPVWTFYLMLRDKYLSKSRKEKLSLVSKYYYDMKYSEKNFQYLPMQKIEDSA